MSHRRAEILGVLGILAITFAVRAEETPKTTATRTAPATLPAETAALTNDRLVCAFPTGDPSQAAYLGVSTSPPQAALQKQLQLNAGVGLVVDTVTAGGPAAKAGIKQYDVLHKLDDQLLINAEQLNVLVRALGPGHDAKFVVIREGKPTPLTAKLEARTLDPVRFSVPATTDRSTPFNYYYGTRRRTPVATADDLDVITLKAPNSSSQVSAAQVIIQDGQRKTTIDTRNRQRHLKVEDKAGKVLFDGPIQTKEQFEKVPAEFRAVLEEFLPNDYTASPQTKPATSDSLPALKSAEK